MRAWWLLTPVVAGWLGGAAACSDAPSRLDALTRARPVRAAPARERAASKLPLDGSEADLRRRLRELTARPLEDGAGGGPLPLDRGTLGDRPHPFGPLAPLQPQMTRAQVRAAIPDVQPDGALLWIATGIEGTTVELTFDAADRLAAVTYRLPLAARSALVQAWGPLDDETRTWLDRERGWRASVDEDVGKRELVVTMSGFSPFAALLGPGPDGLAESGPLVGVSIASLEERLGERLVTATAGFGFAEVVMPRATDLCGAPTELGLEVHDGIVRRARLLQCYDNAAVNRRAVLAAMERQWGPATPHRTKDDRLVFVWTLPERRIEAQQVVHGTEWQWEIAIEATRVSPR